MDFLTIIGMLFGLATILIGQLIEGGNLITLLNIPAVIIVLGGTCAAIMIETSWPVLLQAIQMIPWIFYPPKAKINIYRKKILYWAMLVKRKGILALEPELTKETDYFVRKGLLLLIDKGDPKIIHNILALDLEHNTKHKLTAAKVFENMGGYAPTIGILGAIIGLIQVMSNLEEPSKLGLGIAVAFIATIYGISFANLLFIPIANKLKAIVIKNQQLYAMILAGLVAIADGENSNILELNLLSFANEI